MRTHRRTVAVLAGPGVRAAREVYETVPADAIRVAALVEISAAAAALARTVVRLRRLDPDLIAPHVRDATDLRAVLGRGRWLPTMTRHVPAPPTAAPTGGSVAAAVVPVSRSVRRRVTRSARVPSQESLFQLSA
ncbi:hypothetical protein [Actinoplanes sp. NPDC051859]|uniref:hypothetical protein n=1 Tax=Actinoplanes sp. NPDC051859 TaxID=3363909 RepID=UPI003797C77B